MKCKIIFKQFQRFIILQNKKKNKQKKNGTLKIISISIHR